MTLNDLQNLCAFWLDDLNMTYFTPTQLTFWLNNAQREVQKILLQSHVNFYVTRVQTTLVVNQNDYVLPSDFMTLHRLEMINNGVPPFEDTVCLDPITINQQDLVPSQVGTPQFYFFKKNRLTLLPAPDTALPLRLYYSYAVSDMVNLTDEPDIPRPYHELLGVLATIDGLMKDGRDQSAMQLKKAYYENLLKQETQDRNEDSPRVVTQTGNDLTQMFGYF